jgi:DNA-directed RNA polymerase subunit RPC12/RpoP
MSKSINTPDACPHCGRELSPWEKVLLSVDRVLMCRHCWYRIVLDVRYDDKPKPKDKK